MREAAEAGPGATDAPAPLADEFQKIRRKNLMLGQANFKRGGPV
jgi:hypothetical protein